MKTTLFALVLATCPFIIGCGGDGQVEVRSDLPAETPEEIELKEKLADDYKDEDRSQRSKDD